MAAGKSVEELKEELSMIEKIKERTQSQLRILKIEQKSIRQKLEQETRNKRHREDRIAAEKRRKQVEQDKAEEHRAIEKMEAEAHAKAAAAFPPALSKPSSSLSEQHLEAFLEDELSSL